MIELHCGKCSEIKPIDCFSENNTQRGFYRHGRNGWCKECHHDYYRSRNTKKSRKTFIDRFWEKVDKDGKLHSIHGQCWAWKGGLGSFGYGTLWYNNDNETAHRISWIIHNGFIPKSMQVLHKCDNPPCSNPNHLFLGTHDDNMRDRNNKGRTNKPKGSLHPQTDLCEEEVLEIRNLYKKGTSQAELCRIFGKSQGGIGHIIHRRSWKHI